MPTTIKERAASGAAFLDETSPGWAEKINIERLDMTDCTQCIIGQLYGYYMNIRILNRQWLGFTHFGPEVEWAELRNCWVAEILARRSAR